MTDEERIRFETEIDQSRALTAKLQAETAKLQEETRWYLLVIGSGATLAITAVVKVFF